MLLCNYLNLYISSAALSFFNKINITEEPFGVFSAFLYDFVSILFVCVEVLRPSQPNGVMSSAVSLPNHTFTGQA